MECEHISCISSKRFWIQKFIRLKGLGQRIVWLYQVPEKEKKNLWNGPWKSDKIAETGGRGILSKKEIMKENMEKVKNEVNVENNK